MRTALVTGGTGLFGSYVIERLLADGWSVRAMLRDPSRATDLARRGVALELGDVLDAQRFTAAARGCDVIFHAAAAITPRGGWEEFRRVNVDGTRNAVVAASEAGARLLHVSSVAVYGPGARYASSGGKTDETKPLQPLPERAYYARSKRESEGFVLSAHARGQLWATSIRPSVMYGRNDRQFVPRIGRLLRRGFAPLIGGGRSTLSVVHAANVADGAVRAIATERAGGNAYNVANDFEVSVIDFFRFAAAGLQRRVRMVPVPVAVARVGLTVLSAVGRAALGTRMSVVSPSASLDFLTRNNPFSSDLARRELGWMPTVTPDVGVPDAFQWWAAHR